MPGGGGCPAFKLQRGDCCAEIASIISQRVRLLEGLSLQSLLLIHTPGPGRTCDAVAGTPGSQAASAPARCLPSTTDTSAAPAAAPAATQSSSVVFGFALASWQPIVIRQCYALKSGAS